MSEKSPMRSLSDRLLGARTAAVNLIAITCVCGGNVRLRNKKAITKIITPWKRLRLCGEEHASEAKALHTFAVWDCRG